MSLEMIIHTGYAIMIISILMMLWISYTSAGTCHFDAYCSCSSPHPNLGQIECHDNTVYLPRLNNSKMFTLSLINNRMEYFPPNLLEGTGLYKLIVSNNPMYTLHEDTLSGLEWSLWELHLTYCRLSSIPGNALRHLNKLKTLNLTGNSITNISSEQLKGVAALLQTLILANNHITNLPDGIFSSLISLEALDLSGNAIVSLEPAVFTPPPKKLEFLDLSDNLIERISYKQLSNIGPTLQTVDLSFNKITTLIDHFEKVKLSLDNIYFDYNLIKELEAHSMSNFQIANKTSFKGNPLAVIQPNAFQGCKIVELILSECRLNSIDPDSFNGLQSTLQHLDLEGNNITTLDYSLIKNFTLLRDLNLEHNNVEDMIWSVPPGENKDYLQIFQLRLDGNNKKPVNLQKLPKLPHLQYFSTSHITEPAGMTSKDLDVFSVELEIMKLTESNLKVLNANLFKEVRGIKTFDLTDNRIEKIESKCFEELSHSLENLILTRSFSSKISTLPRGLLRPLSKLGVLKINHNSLTKLPQEINTLNNLRVLHAQDNKIDALYRGIFKGEVHHKLIEINLSFNKIIKIPANTFMDLTEIIEINLSDNTISVIEEGAFANMHHLTKLYLRGNKVATVGAEIFQNLPSVNYLDLAYNSLHQFAFDALDQVGTLSTLAVNVSHNNLAALTFNSSFSGKYSLHSYIKILDMSHNNISSIERNYFLPVQDSLTHLYLSYNSLFNSTRDLFPELPQLQLLDISNNAFADLEFDSLRSFKKVQVVLLSHNKLKQIPDGLFSSLDTLRKIDLSYNSLYTIMDAIISPPHLVHMDLSNNGLTRIPLSAFTPTSASNLLHFNLSNNKISGVPSADSFSRFNRLLSLDLSSNRITDIGNSLSLLSSLSTLNLAHNNLHIGPKDFAGLENKLRHLNLANTSISYVPSLPLPSLLTLDLSHNAITFVPPDLSTNLTNLKYLNLGFNSIVSIPIFPQLKSLKLAGNQIILLVNTSFTDFPYLTELDIRRLPLTEFDVESLSAIRRLHILRISNYPKIAHFNVPEWVNNNDALRVLNYEIRSPGSIGADFRGALPRKVSQIIISGLEIQTLPEFLLEGIRNPVVELVLKNTSVEFISKSIFSSLSYVRNISLFLEGDNLRILGNPSNCESANTPKKTYLTNLRMYGNNWNCDCQMGWIETWQRKRRQLNSHDYTIENSRQISCKNNQNKSLLNVLKEDIECGWGNGGNKFVHNFIILTTSIIILLINFDL